MAKKTKAPASPATATAAAKPTLFRVFYSWQSDLIENRKFLRRVLELAGKQFEQRTGCPMVVDEATREETGAPHIPDTILRKIREADYIVCDLTTVASNTARKLPNPNVCIEMGFAIAELGWARIGILFNKAHGNFPGDLPFDTDKRRALDYEVVLLAEEEDPQGVRGEVVASLVKELVAVYKKNPIRARLLAKSDMKKVLRDRDIQKIESLLSQVSHSAMDYFIENAHNRYITHSIFHFQAQVDSVASGSSFHINDKDLLARTMEFVIALDANLEFSEYTRDTNTDKYRFVAGHEDASMDIGVVLKKFALCTSRTESAWRSLLEYIREHYPEIDLDELSRKAYQDYVTYMREFEQRISGDTE